MRRALRYGLERGLIYGGLTALTLLSLRPSFEAGQWIAEQLLLLRHGGGDVWLGI